MKTTKQDKWSSHREQQTSLHPTMSDKMVKGSVIRARGGGGSHRGGGGDETSYAIRLTCKSDQRYDRAIGILMLSLTMEEEEEELRTARQICMTRNRSASSIVFFYSPTNPGQPIVHRALNLRPNTSYDGRHDVGNEPTTTIPPQFGSRTSGQNPAQTPTSSRRAQPQPPRHYLQPVTDTGKLVGGRRLERLPLLLSRRPGESPVTGGHRCARHTALSGRQTPHDSPLNLPTTKLSPG